MRYDRVWANLVGAAVEQGSVDLQTFIGQALETGMTASAIQDRLLADLDEGGPIFGRFFRALSGAAQTSASVAYEQGGDLGSIDGDDALRELLALRTNVNDVGSVVDIADPDAMDNLRKAVADRDERMWVAELINTCHVCLPLHGAIRTMQQWGELGYHPSTIHSIHLSPNAAKCHCKLVPVKQTDRVEVMGPLVRNKLTDAGKGSGPQRTQRGITQPDIDRANAARDKALESVGGRRVLKILGSSAAGA